MKEHEIVYSAPPNDRTSGSWALRKPDVFYEISEAIKNYNNNQFHNYYLNGDDVVYAYTATSDTSINVFMSPDATYSGIFVYDSCDDIGVECVAGIGVSNDDNREFDMNVYSGTTYYFVISTWASPQSVGYDLVISENTLQLLVSWELVGLCSFALIGHWWEEKNSSFCQECNECVPKCPSQLDIPNLLKQTHNLLIETPTKRLWG